MMIYQEGTRLINSFDMFNSNDIFKIPNYQRAYTWGHNSLNNFINDILTKGINNDYYLGTLYIVKDTKKDNIRYVIDGQQRITTLLLLLNAFRIKYNIDISKYIKRNGGYPVLDTYEATPQFYKLLIASNINEISNLHSEIKNQSLTASQVIYNQLAIFKLLETYDVNSINIEEMLKHLLFVNISVEKEIYGYQIFENLNSKGITLTNVDIIKNSLFSRIKDELYVEPHSSTKYKKWKEIEDNMMNFTCSDLTILDKVKKEFIGNLEDMMKFYTHCKTKKKSITKTNYGISRVYIDFLEDKKIEPLAELCELSRYSDYAKYVFYPKDIIHNYTIGRRLNKYFKSIETLNVKQHRNMSIGFIKQITYQNCSNLENDILSFYKKLVIFHYLFNTISSEVPSKISGVYLDAAIKLYDDNITEPMILEIISDVLESLNANLPTEETIKDRIKKTIFYIKEEVEKKIKIDKREYKVYEGKFYGSNLFEIIETSIDRNVSDFRIESIEHLLNQNESIANYENYKLYSMLPLETKINSDMGKKTGMTLKEKINYLRKSNYFLVKEFVKYYDEKLEDKLGDVQLLLEWKNRFVKILFDVYRNL